MALDDTDRRLVAVLQRDARLSNQELGDALHLSASQAGRRRQALQAAGVISGYRANLDPAHLGLTVQAFVQVELASHSRSIADDFLRHCDQLRDVVSVWTLTGESDYLLRVYCEDLKGLNRLLQHELLRHEAVLRLHSQVVLDQVKADAGLPV